MPTTVTTKDDPRLFSTLSGTIRVLFPTEESRKDFERAYYRVWRTLVIQALPGGARDIAIVWDAPDYDVAIPLMITAIGCERDAEEGKQPHEIEEYAIHMLHKSIKDQIEDRRRAASRREQRPRPEPAPIKTTPKPSGEESCLDDSIQVFIKMVGNALRKYSLLAFDSAFPAYMAIVGDHVTPEILADERHPTVTERRPGDRGKVTCRVCGKKTGAARLQCSHCKQPIG